MNDQPELKRFYLQTRIERQLPDGTVTQVRRILDKDHHPDLIETGPLVCIEAQSWRDAREQI